MAMSVALRRLRGVPLELSRTDARRLAVLGQMLSAPQPRTIAEVVIGLGEVQMDPTASIARTEHLVLWSRLGRRFKVADLERMLWEERSLFEYWAHILPTADFGIHRDAMRRYLADDATRHRYVRDWLAANAAFRRYVLRELRLRGPLRTRDLEDRTAEGWRTGGWNDEGRFTGMMLEVLWARGEVMVAGRDGGQRLWDLAERVLPVAEPKLRPTRASRDCPVAGTPTRTCWLASVASGHAPSCSRRSTISSATAAAPSGSSTSPTGSRSTCRRRSGSTATSCCRSCTATG
jgi:uncharacterized protein YcaQ